MLPYSLEVLFSVIADMNSDLWYALGAAMVLGAGILFATVLPVLRPLDRVAGYAVAAGWIAVGSVFYGLYLAPFFFAAPWFQWVFTVQGVLLVLYAVMRSADLRRDAGPAMWVGRSLMGYGLLGLPIVDLLFGADWHACRVIGLAPEPTVVFTCGWLLTRRPHWLVPVLAFIPLASGAAAGFSAVALAWNPDWVVLLAAVTAFVGSLGSVALHRPR